MFRFWLNHHQGARSMCFAKLLYWYQLIYWVIKIVRSCGRMLIQSFCVCVSVHSAEWDCHDGLVKSETCRSNCLYFNVNFNVNFNVVKQNYFALVGAIKDWISIHVSDGLSVRHRESKTADCLLTGTRCSMSDESYTNRSTQWHRGQGKNVSNYTTLNTKPRHIQ